MNYEQRVQEILLDAEFRNAVGDGRFDIATHALISLIRQAKIEELERLQKGGHAHFTAPIYIENRVADLKAEAEL